MEYGAMVVAALGIMGGVGTFCFLLHTIKSVMIGRPRKTDQEILAEVQALRAEVQELKRQNNELFLALDDQATVRRLSQPRETTSVSQFVGRQ